MARTDRLMRLMDALRRLPAPVTAMRLAEETGVSQRQLYRDIATLRAGGALVDGEAGLGYVLTEDTALPPQSFSRLEIEALMLALTALEQIADPVLIRAGQDALARIIATLPDPQGRHAMHATMHSWREPASRPPITVDLDILRNACWEEQSLVISYTDKSGDSTSREIWPLAMSYNDETLTLLAYCQLRQDYRFFHLHRVASLATNGGNFRPQRVRLLKEFRQGRHIDAARDATAKAHATPPSRNAAP